MHDGNGCLNSGKLIEDPAIEFLILNPHQPEPPQAIPEAEAGGRVQGFEHPIVSKDDRIQELEGALQLATEDMLAYGDFYRYPNWDEIRRVQNGAPKVEQPKVGRKLAGVKVPPIWDKGEPCHLCAHRRSPESGDRVVTCPNCGRSLAWDFCDISDETIAEVRAVSEDNARRAREERLRGPQPEKCRNCSGMQDAQLGKCQAQCHVCGRMVCTS